MMADVEEVRADTGQQSSGPEGTDMKHIKGPISIDLNYVKSILGIFEASEIILSLLGLICVSAHQVEYCEVHFASSYSYYEFVSSSCFIVSLLWYIIYLLAIPHKLKFVRWDIAELIWLVAYVLQFFIASIVVAVRDCDEGTLRAGAAFGFLCMFALIGHFLWQFRKFWANRAESRSSASSPPPYSPDGNVDNEAEKY